MQIRRYCTQNIFILASTALFYFRRQAFHRALAVGGHRKSETFCHWSKMPKLSPSSAERNPLPSAEMPNLSPSSAEAKPFAIGRNSETLSIISEARPLRQNFSGKRVEQRFLRNSLTYSATIFKFSKCLLRRAVGGCSRGNEGKILFPSTPLR